MSKWCAGHGSFNGWCEHDRPYEHIIEEDSDEQGEADQAGEPC